MRPGPLWSLTTGFRIATSREVKYRVYSGFSGDCLSVAHCRDANMYQTYPSAAHKAHERLCEQIEIFLQHGGHIQQIASGVTGSPEGVSKVQWKKERTAK
ncbi:hypothetical protein [Pseudomonas sp. NBRC 111123]|uniref:hypothetical protein n=1 Tax=Pseudomonas sp. NBRC 111123 TaxID=1661038 RepID=UPI0035276927